MTGKSEQEMECTCGEINARHCQVHNETPKSDEGEVDLWKINRALQIQIERANHILVEKHKFIVKLQSDRDRYRTALEKIELEDRMRGYPQGIEWIRTIKEVREALQKSKGS